MIDVILFAALVTFSDGCLGWGGEQMRCAAVLVPGVVEIRQRGDVLVERRCDLPQAQPGENGITTTVMCLERGIGKRTR